MLFSQELCQDANVRVTLTKVFKDNQLVLVFFLTNQKQERLSGVSLVVTPPTTMKAATGAGGHDLTFTSDLTGFANVCN